MSGVLQKSNLGPIGFLILIIGVHLPKPFVPCYHTFFLLESVIVQTDLKPVIAIFKKAITITRK